MIIPLNTSRAEQCQSINLHIRQVLKQILNNEQPCFIQIVFKGAIQCINPFTKTSRDLNPFVGRPGIFTTEHYLALSCCLFIFI